MNESALPAWLGRPLVHLGEQPISLGSLIVAALFVIAIWWLASLLERSLQRLAEKHADEPASYARMHVIGRILRYLTWVLGTLVGLNHLGIDLSNVAMLGSALAVGLGFGLQNIVSNFVSGIIILLERSLKVGDFVDLESGVQGHVREIAMRYTRIATNDSIDILVPNSQFINGRVVNWTHDDSFRRIHVPFGVAYGTPKEKVQTAGLAAARSVEGIVDNQRMPPAVWLVSYGDNSVNYELVVWAERRLTTRPSATHARLMWALDDQLHAHNIEIPFPQRDLHIRSGELAVRMVQPTTQDA